MAVKPYFKCISCGALNDFSRTLCSACGASLNGIRPVFLDEETQTDPQETLCEKEETGNEFYTIQCPDCHKIYRVKKDERIRKCSQCGRIRIRYQIPRPECEPEKSPARKLVLRSTGAYEGHELILCPESSPVIVGRAEAGREFLVQDPRVGEKHCTFCYYRDHWYVSDSYDMNHHSTNGTIVNTGSGRWEDDHPVSAAVPYELKTGYLIVLGNRMDSMTLEVMES